jgi:hypothetical protein
MKWEKNRGIRPCDTSEAVAVRYHVAGEALEAFGRAGAFDFSIHERPNGVITHYCILDVPPFDYEEPHVGRAWNPHIQQWCDKVTVNNPCKCRCTPNVGRVWVNHGHEWSDKVTVNRSCKCRVNEDEPLGAWSLGDYSKIWGGVELRLNNVAQAYVNGRADKLLRILKILNTEAPDGI